MDSMILRIAFAVSQMLMHRKFGAHQGRQGADSATLGLSRYKQLTLTQLISSLSGDELLHKRDHLGHVDRPRDRDRRVASPRVLRTPPAPHQQMMQQPAIISDKPPKHTEKAKENREAVGLLLQQQVHGGMPGADALGLHPHHALPEREQVRANQRREAHGVMEENYWAKRTNYELKPSRGSEDGNVQCKGIVFSVPGAP